MSGHDSTVTAHTTGTQPVQSDEFPPSYGDLALLSSDNVIFHFPRAILAHVSPVFRDMLEVGNQPSEATINSNSEPIKLTEDGETLKVLLSHIDPVISTPNISKSTIFRLILAADKYQVDSILRWFQTAIFTPPGHTFNSISDNIPLSHRISFENTFAYKHPFLFLSLAERLKIDQLIRRALQILIMQPMTALQEKGIFVDYNLLLHVLSLRQQRITWFLQHIENAQKRFFQSSYVKCILCLEAFMKWCLECTNAIHDTPSWRSISTTGLYRHCDTCGETSVSDDILHRVQCYGAIDWTIWYSEAKALENLLPDLPN